MSPVELDGAAGNSVGSSGHLQARRAAPRGGLRRHQPQAVEVVGMNEPPQRGRA